MKRLLTSIAVVILCIAGIALFVRTHYCRTYLLSDFDHIKIGISTVRDLDMFGYYDMHMTSFGGICEYPTVDGQYIRIRIGMPGSVVEKIEVVDEPW